ncbi:MAG: cupredoxin domain-containing protein [Coriobacteriia bacterium]|jgi:plastocyanin
MSKKSTKNLRTGLIMLIVVLAFVASYQIATAAERDSVSTAGASSIASVATASDGSLPCACCGDGANAEPIEGAAAVEGDVQRITVDTSKGYYDPNIITLSAGVPAEITFTQAGGCLAEVVSQDLDFYADLTGGEQTITLTAEQLQPGTYGFSCGMQMVFGTIIVE